MNFRVSHILNEKGQAELTHIHKLEQEMVVGSTLWLKRSVKAIPSSCFLMAVLLCNAFVEMASSIHKLACWLWQSDLASERLCSNQLYTAFVVRPITILILPLRIVYEPLYRRIALYIDYTNYTKRFEGTLQPDAVYLEHVSTQTKKIEPFLLQSNPELWPHDDELILPDFEKEHHLFFEGRARAVEKVQLYVHSLRDEIVREESIVSFYQKHIGLPDCSLDTLRAYYTAEKSKLITRVKHALTVQFLVKKGIPKRLAPNLALKAMALSTRETWEPFRELLKKLGIEISLLQNNLIVTAEKRVFLELRTINYLPQKEAWSVRDLIPLDTEHQSATYRIELTDEPHSSLEVEIGAGTTGWDFPEMRGGTFVAESHQFISLVDALPTY